MGRPENGKKNSSCKFPPHKKRQKPHAGGGAFDKKIEGQKEEGFME